MAHTKEHNKDFQDRVVGAYKRKSDAKRANKLKDGVESFDGGDFTLKSKHAPNDKRRQKAVARQNQKDARRERRAKRIGARKLMSDEQAQDFMRNRKDRFNTAFGNVLLDLTGNEDKKGVIKDRYYRKEGSGTIQNVAKLDSKGNPTGETYDATDPFQFSGTRIKAEKRINVPKKAYDLIQPKPMADLNIDIGPKEIQKEIVEEKKKKKIEEIVDPPAMPTPTFDFSVNAYSDTVNPTTPNLYDSEGNINENSFMSDESQKDRDRRGLAANRGGFFQRLFNIGG